MDKKIVIILLNTDPDRPASLGTPFFQASAAAALDLEVEIYFTARNIQLLHRGVADKLYPGKQQQKSIYSFMQDAHNAGVKFYACSGGMDDQELDASNAIPELDGAKGAAALMSQLVEGDTVPLAY